MASGKSLEQRYITRDNPQSARETRARDRSLSGKARRKAAKAARKIG